MKKLINKTELRPLVSVIVPTYNRADFLVVAIKSILRQTYSNLELIIISDASPDNTTEVVNSFEDERIRYFELEKNLKLPSAVRNVGISKAQGEFIAFCDDDDFWREDRLEKQIKCFEKRHTIDMIATNSYLFPGYILPAMILFKDRIISYNELFSKQRIITPSVIIRRNILIDDKLFDEDCNLKIGEDWDLWLRILKNKDKSLLLLKECLVFNRYGNIKITSTNFDPIKFYNAKLLIFSKHPSKRNLYEFYIENKKSIIEKDNYIYDKQEVTRNLYLKNISIAKLITDNNGVVLKDKILLIIKLFLKIIYKYVMQKPFSMRNIEEKYL